MSLLYLICATIGGSVLVIQFAMTLLGLRDDGHMAHGDTGGDVGHDVSHAGGGEHGGEHGDGGGQDPHGSTSLFQIISMRTVTAALAFFGLTGLAAESQQLPTGTTVMLALGAGFAAMYSVHWRMGRLLKLRSDGTVRLNRAVGRSANVYVRVPARGQGVGKVVLTLQNRTVELDAVSEGEAIPAGTQVVVQSLTGAEVVQVTPCPAPDEVTHA